MATADNLPPEFRDLPKAEEMWWGSGGWNRCVRDELGDHAAFGVLFLRLVHDLTEAYGPAGAAVRLAAMIETLHNLPDDTPQHMN